MKKEVILIFGLIFLVSAGVFAQSVSNSLDKNVENYIKDFTQKAEIIQEIEIKSIDENKIGIYEVNYTQNNETKKIFVVTYATTQLKKKESAIIKNIQNLYFGYSGNSKKA